jgi:hypothetical protein
MEIRVPHVVLDRAEAGYVWNAKGTTIPNTRRPLKNGYYDDGQNRVEFITLLFGPGTRLKPAPKREPSRSFPIDPLSCMAV